MKPRDPKVCTICKESKPRTEFYSRPTARSPQCVTSECRECAKDKARNVCRKAQSTYNRASKLKSTYGMTIAQYDALLEQQGGCCAICKRDTPNGKGRFHVDHCHDSGEIRGLLCHSCNVGLGNFFDDANILAAAIQYLGGARG